MIPLITIDTDRDDLTHNPQHISLSDSLTFYHTDITESLRKKSQIFIKSYGAGSSSTLSIRGGTANQSLVRWQEVPVNNPMLGLSDISLISTGLFDQLSIIKGGGSSSVGNGAITGVIDIGNSIYSDNKINLHSGIGSLGQRQIDLSMHYNIGKVSASTKVLYMKNKNDFEYKISNGDRRKITHAAMESKALLQSFVYPIDSDKILRYDFWTQDTYREIPPTTTQTRSEATQDDKLFRHVLSYNQQMNQWHIKSTLAYFHEINDYADPQILIDNHNIINRLYHKTEAIIPLHDSDLLTFSYDINHVQGNSESYSDTQSVTYYNLYAHLQKNYLSHTINFRLHNEISSLGQHFVSPSVDYRYVLTPTISVNAKLSREYRLPTLNELHWQPGGNTDLQPEQGWNQELGATYTDDKHNITVGLYHRLIDDWILWGLPDNTNFWAAYNLSQVRSYGLELNYNKSIDLDQWNFKIQGGHNYTISKNLKASTNPKINEGDQLFYTPKHITTFNVETTFRNWRYNIHNRYTSSTTGVLSELPSYWLLSMDLSRQINIWGKQLSLSLSVDNLTNQSYRIIERRPMPGRNYFIHFNVYL